MSQKLDSLSKIIIATGQINYMAVSIDSVNEQIKFVPDKEGFHKEGIEARNEILSKIVTKLTAIMEELGDLINNQDCICHLDTRVSKVPFEILLDGKDDTETEYDATYDLAHALNSLKLSVTAHPDYTGEENEEWTDLVETAEEALAKYNKQ